MTFVLQQHETFILSNMQPSYLVIYDLCTYYCICCASQGLYRTRLYWYKM